MPIYEYQCQGCGHQLEILQKVSDGSITSCPSCHSEKLIKQMSSTSFRLKGNGWYATDFKAKPNANQPVDNKLVDNKPDPKPADNTANVSATTQSANKE